jgi:seryl-tRNA synthetase
MKVKEIIKNMLDIKFIRENKDAVVAGANKKHISVDIDELLKVDDERLEVLRSVEEKRAKQNEVSKQIPQASEEEKQKLLEEMTTLKSELQGEEDKLKDLMTTWRELMLQVPNIPDMSVPEGKDEEENQETRKWGEVPKFDFEVKNHIELMEQHDLADFEKGTKIAGFRGYVLKNEGAMLQSAVLNFAMDKMIEKGYTPMSVPSVVRKETLLGTGYLPQGEDDLYKTQDEDYLSGTAEVPTMSYYADEVISKEKLPIKMVSYSPCYRREAGSHGKDVKGLYRVHEFKKVEQVILCEASHEESVKLHEEILANSEEIMQALEIPYRVVTVCGGDLGLGQVKKYDIEAWIPSQEKYGETHSASYFHDFQTRRLNIKYQDADKKKLVHSLNNTAIATPRILIQILENTQTADGKIKIPEVLRPYMGGKEIIG